MSVILVVAAHPDDEVLGCGGLIGRLSSSHQTHIAILGEGLSSRYDRREAADAEALMRLKTDARAVGEMLGVQSVVFEQLPDNRFDELPFLEVVKRVERLVDSIRPEIIYTHLPGDLNVDHRVTFRAVMTATRPVRDCPVREIYAFEVASSTEWAFQQLQPAFKPNVFADISSTIEMKINAMARYQTEARAFPHPRSSEAIRVQARRWGVVVGLDYAEAFELIRSVR
jgi:LmbE family N-acetylglucosaminyl deacetylase